MVRRLGPFVIAAAIAMVGSLASVEPTLAVTYVSGDLFHNYYAPGSPAAALYPSPRPTPPWVGHTYVTYQPLMPQEFLYAHERCYYRKNGCAGWTKTTVCWGHSLFDWSALCHPRQVTLPSKCGWCYPSK